MVSIALPDRTPSSPALGLQAELPFCHTFDMSKRLVLPQDVKINHLSISPGADPFNQILQRLEQSLKASPASSIHRLIMPTILSAALYPPQASRPENFIRFLHSLRSLLRRYSNQLTAMMTLPLELYPRSSGLVRWAEILSDGVIELTPFPHLMDASNAVVESGGARANEEQPQGMIKVHKSPINTERGEGGAGAGNSIGEDLAFTVSRRKFVIKPFSLPPLEGDSEAQKEGAKLTGREVEF
jgi:elongator complex protein 4